MGGGAAQRGRRRRIFWITCPWVMAAMRRRVPCRHTGPVARARERPAGAVGYSSSALLRCWLHLHPRPADALWERGWRAACSARHTPERTRWTRGSGTNAASFSSLHALEGKTGKRKPAGLELELAAYLSLSLSSLKISCLNGARMYSIVDDSLCHLHNLDVVRWVHAWRLLLPPTNHAIQAARCSIK